MSGKDCCSNDECRNVNVNVNVDVPKIVKYSCITGILIVGIIFGSKCFGKMLEKGYFDQLDK
ncbi:MAG TPA: hypothetical protein VN258_18530 [Mobilitalea sp.]|nr:hypothetical protein [Mobilitalea sp.]